MRVPGDVHSALLAAGVIPDPYHGRNEYAVRWVADRDWTLTPQLRAPDADGPWTLVDRRARHHRRGPPQRRTACSTAAHQLPRASAPTSPTRLVAGREPDRDPAPLQPRAPPTRSRPRQPFPVPYSADNCPIPNGNMLRKPQCDFGWDWNIALAPARPLRPRRRWSARRGRDRRRRHPPAPPRRPRRPRRRGRPLTRLRRRGRRLAASRSAASPRPATRRRRRRLRRLAADARPSTDPALWWPAGTARQPLHDLVDHRRRRHPHRPRRPPRHPPRLRARRRPAAASRSSVNGRDIFARGANWIPADALPGRITDAEDPRPAAVRRRRQHEHDPRLGRRPLRARLLLRGLRRPRPPGLAGLHVRLPPLPRDRRNSSPRSRARSTTRSRRLGAPRRALVRRQRAHRRAHLVRGIAQQPRPLPRRLRPPQPHHRDRAQGAPSPTPTGGPPAPRPARCPSATPGTTTAPATCTSGRSGTRAATSSTTATSARASAPSSASSPTPRCR